MTDETYLGDGLYASYDGYQIKLRAPSGGVDNKVYLDPNTMNEFVQFVENTFNLRITVGSRSDADFTPFIGGKESEAAGV